MEALAAKGTFLFGLKIGVTFSLILNVALTFVHLPRPLKNSGNFSLILFLFIYFFFHAVKINADTVAEWTNWLFQKIEWVNPIHIEQILGSIHSKSFKF